MEERETNFQEQPREDVFDTRFFFRTTIPEFGPATSHSEPDMSVRKLPDLFRQTNGSPEESNTETQQPHEVTFHF